MGFTFEVVAVDDFSTDGSADILRELAGEDSRLRAFFSSANQGKGAALHVAISQMRGEIMIVQDADLEYDPAEIPQVVAPILDGKADAVFGSRFANNDCRRILNFRHSFMNKILTFIGNLACDLAYTDMHTCYKAAKADLVKSIPLRCKGFGFDPEFAVRLTQWNARIYEVPISYMRRTYAEGKKITWKDGIRSLITIVWMNFVDRRFTTHSGLYSSTVARRDGLNKWIYRRVQKYLVGDIVEVGCGVGNFTSLLLEQKSVLSVDADPLYIKTISQRFSNLENIHCVQSNSSQASVLEIVNKESKDTIISLHSLEQKADDRATLQSFYESLKSGGHAIILVEQHPEFYDMEDVASGRHRRYSKDELCNKLSEAGFDVVQIQDFNRMACVSFLLTNKLMHLKKIPPWAMSLFDLFLPAAKIVEQFSFIPGLSLIAIARKPGQKRQTTEVKQKILANGLAVSSVENK